MNSKIISGSYRIEQMSKYKYMDDTNTYIYTHIQTYTHMNAYIYIHVYTYSWTHITTYT